MSAHRLLATALAALTLAAAVPGPAVEPDGPWVWPLAGGGAAMVRGFDPPAQPWEAGHRGVDLLGAEDEPVRAAGAGVVTYAGPIAGVGVVTVTHGAHRTTYQPVRTTVSVGDRVMAGDPIGTLAQAGSHCPPSACLHWGLLRGDTYLDPISLIQHTGRPRLLPLGERALHPGPAALPADDVPGAHPPYSNAHPHTIGSDLPGTVTRHAAAGALAGLGGSS
jgi:murein DD-endopeptidase MepM/ murein hydrolase activator NlpD